MKKHKILILDDDADLLNLAKLVLEKHNMEIMGSQSSEDAYKKLAKSKPDLIILDVMLQEEKDGFEICRDLKSRPEYQNIPVLMLTGINEYYPFDFKPEEAWLPSDGFLDKPFEPEVLVGRVKRLLDIEEAGTAGKKAPLKLLEVIPSMKWQAKLPPLTEVDNVSEPNLLRDLFPYSEVPKITFEDATVPIDLPEDIWITCTTFRDGQQARVPYSVEQIVDLYDMMHRLGGPNGVIRQCEFFLYSQKDREAIMRCLDRGYKYPEITGWVRASEVDFKVIKWMGLKETGILTSASDYHLYLKMGKDRKKKMNDYISLVYQIIDAGVVPRCHFEDITRADIYGFVIPLAQRLMEVAAETKVPIKIRMCDTMGYGVPFAEAALPRSVPKIVAALKKEAGVPSADLEWHGHNDFHNVMGNGMAAWLYGCSSLNGTLLGFGERTGNPPIEAACIAYAQLTGSTNGMDLTVINEIARYLEKKTGAVIPPNYPFVGKYFNMTMAGIHADGLIKNEEIYNIFDTGKILNRPLVSLVNDKSGGAGLALWYNNHLGLTGSAAINKKDSGIIEIDEWIKVQYGRDKRTTSMSPDELITQGKIHLKKFFERD